MSAMKIHWISVDDALPPYDVDAPSFCLMSIRVLCWADKAMSIGYVRWYDAPSDGYSWVEDGRDSYALDNVTHWTYLPCSPV